MNVGGWVRVIASRGRSLAELAAGFAGETENGQGVESFSNTLDTRAGELLDIVFGVPGDVAAARAALGP